MIGPVVAILVGAVAAEIQFEQGIAQLPPERQARLRQCRRQWQEAMRRQAEDSARHSGCEQDSLVAFLLGVALGVVIG